MSLSDVARFIANLPPERRVSHPYLSQIELGQVFRLAPERLQSIARVLQVPPAWLLEKAGMNEKGLVDVSNQDSSPLVEHIAFRAAQLEPTDQKMFLETIEAVVKMKLGKGKPKCRFPNCSHPKQAGISFPNFHSHIARSHPTTGTKTDCANDLITQFPRVLRIPAN